MTRAGDEMIHVLATLLDTNTIKTASKKDKEEDVEKKDNGKDKKKEKDDEKDEKKDKKASVIVSVVNDLVKIANDLDNAGAQEASDLVDDALKIILDKINQG